MPVDKEKLQLGEMFSATINSMPEFVEVVQLNPPVPQIKNKTFVPNKEFLNSVGVRLLRNNELTSLNAGQLNPILLSDSILTKMGFNTTTRDGFPMHYLGSTIITRFSLTNNSAREVDIKVICCIVDASEWSDFKKSLETSERDLKVVRKQIYEKYEEAVELNGLVRYLEKRGHKFNLDEILKEE